VGAEGEAVARDGDSDSLVVVALVALDVVALGGVVRDVGTGIVVAHDEDSDSSVVVALDAVALDVVALDVVVLGALDVVVPGTNADMLGTDVAPAADDLDTDTAPVDLGKTTATFDSNSRPVSSEA
jgi:hypothetical protein